MCFTPFLYAVTQIQLQTTVNCAILPSAAFVKAALSFDRIIRQVLLFALPLCAGNILQQLYTTVDTLVIGNYCSS